MRISLKTLNIQLLGSFLLIILFSLAIGTISEYFTYASQLPGLITEITTKSMARQLSSIYTKNRGWNDLEAEMQRLNNLESLNPLDDANLRVIIRDGDGRTIYNSFLAITQIETNELIEGDSYPVIDYTAAETVGMITIYISREYILRHAGSYISGLLRSALLKALVTASIAFLFSLLLSRRITRPLLELTDAAQSIAENRESELLSFESTDELVRLSRAFNRMIDSLHEQQESRRQLVADISHQINTPLNAIRLEARGLADGLVPPDEAGYYIMNEVDKLTNVIYDLDWLSENDSGGYPLKTKEYRIEELLSEEKARWSIKAETRGMSIITETSPEPLPPAVVDVIRIRTVIGNLIDNAVKYAPAGSRIRLGCRMKNDSIEVFVCDDGPAIAEEDRSSVFDRFYRSGSRDDSVKPGSGLGLSIVKQITERHKGTVRLECGAKKGNCFILTLPAVPESKNHPKV